MYREDFGTIGNDPVYLYRLGNEQGFKAAITNYGGIVTELHVADKNGKYEDVVLGFNSLDEYLKPHPYFGAIIGRIAGRLTKGRFELEGDVYELETNDSANHLHGGLKGFDKQLWDSDIIKKGEEEVLLFSYKSHDGEEGYPGNLNIEVSYSLKENCELWIEYKAVTDKATPLCMTNHSYFNLGGEGNGSILDHQVFIDANDYVPTDEIFTLSGERKSLDGLPNDFRKNPLKSLRKFSRWN